MINRFDRDGTRHLNGALVLHDDVLNLENENDKLREALEKIDCLEYGDTNSEEFDQQQSTRFLLAKNIAMKALKWEAELAHGKEVWNEV